MTWRPAYSLQTLKDQLDKTYPGWLFLGFLGDAAHASGPSDHNPNSAGVVCALDIGPGGGLKIHELADNLLAVRQPDLKYIISNYRIAGAFTDWNWGYYDGIDPHDTHIHVSVGKGPDGQSVQPYDDRIQWNVTGQGGDMPITKEMEMSEAYKATGSYPGTNYNYQFVGTTDYNGMLSFWQGQMTLIAAADEKRVAEGATGIPNVIGKDYNSQFVGKPTVSHYSKMTDFWNKQPKASDGEAKVLPTGKYKVI